MECPVLLYLLFLCRSWWCCVRLFDWFFPILWPFGMLRIPHPALLKWTCHGCRLRQDLNRGRAAWEPATSQREADYGAIRGLQSRQTCILCLREKELIKCCAFVFWWRVRTDQWVWFLWVMHLVKWRKMCCWAWPILSANYSSRQCFFFFFFLIGIIISLKIHPLMRV